MDVKNIQILQGQKEWSPVILFVVCILIMTGTFLLDLQLPLGIACAIPYSIAVIVAAFLDSRWLLLGITFTTSILTLVGMVYSPKAPEVSTWQVLSNRGMAIFSMWMVALLLDHRNTLQTKKEEALARIRVLEGLLPICAQCKKIRDGSNIWHQMEVFITNHSQAQFTHGYCPECSKRFLAQYRKDRPKN